VDDKPESFFAVVAATGRAKAKPFVVESTLRTQAKVIYMCCLETFPDAVIKKYTLTHHLLTAMTLMV